MEISTVVLKPIKSQAVRYDGTVDSGRFLSFWVRSSTAGQKLHFENEDHMVNMVLENRKDSQDLLVNWWLVKNPRGIFEVYTPEEFIAKFAIKIDETVQVEYQGDSDAR